MKSKIALVAATAAPLLAGLSLVTLTAVVAPASALAQPPASSPPPATAPDRRVGLKPGMKDAGVAASNMERVAGLPKPEGFFDPKAPAGEPMGGDETATPAAGAKPETAPPSGAPAADPKPPADPGTQKPTPGASALNYANSDLAFTGTTLFVGNFNGFNTYDVSNPTRPKLIGSVICPGGQGDVSVAGNLLVMSVEQTRGRLDCGTSGVEQPISTDRFRGVRIFDIIDVRKPKQVAAVQTCRGSHTHTLVTNPKDPSNLYIYGSGTSAVRSAEELAGCSGGDPKDDPDTALFSIDVIQVPVASPGEARIVSRPRIFADLKSGAISGLWPGGSHGEGTQTTSVTNQCHDITVYPEIGLAAGACSGNGILLDISNPVAPVRLADVSDKNFAYWHSATFSNDGSKVIFTDEWGGGTRPRCRATDLPAWGANAIFRVVDRTLEFAGYYKLPAPQTEQENCVAHNGSLVPVPGRDIMVQAWYQGGISVFDFTDPAKPFEIAYFDRGPLDATRLITGGFWSAYWYNGYIYGTEIARGIDIFRLTPSAQLSKDEIAAAALVTQTTFNAQEQPRVTWPASPVVARAYLDQLVRSNGIATERAAAVRAALDRSDKPRLAALAAELQQDASTAAAPDAARLKSLAATLTEVGAPRP